MLVRLLTAKDTFSVVDDQLYEHLRSSAARSRKWLDHDGGRVLDCSEIHFEWNMCDQVLLRECDANDSLLAGLLLT